MRPDGYDWKSTTFLASYNITSWERTVKCTARSKLCQEFASHDNELPTTFLNVFSINVFLFFYRPAISGDPLFVYLLNYAFAKISVASTNYVRLNTFSFVFHTKIFFPDNYCWIVGAGQWSEIKRLFRAPGDFPAAKGKRGENQNELRTASHLQRKMFTFYAAMFKHFRRNVLQIFSRHSSCDGT